MLRVVNIALKDLRVWSRDPSALAILLAMPALLIVILGSALGGVMSGSGSHIAVAIVNLDSRLVASGSADDAAAKLEDALANSKRLQALFAIERSRDLPGVERRIGAGELSAALVIPKGFSADLGASGARLIVLKDPGAGTASGIWESVVRAVATRYSAIVIAARTAAEAAQNANSPTMARSGGVPAVMGLALAQGARDDALDKVTVLDTVINGAAKVTSLDYYSLSMTAMFLMFGAMFGAFSTIREKREQTMARMLASSTARGSVVGGKMLGVFLLGMAQFLALWGFTALVLHVRWGGDPAATLLVAIGEMAAVTGLATFIAGLGGSERAVGAIGPLIVQIQALVGGAFFPVTILPAWLQWVKYLSVVGWTMEGWRRVQVLGLGVPAVVGPTLALFAFAVVFYAFGVWRAGAAR